METAAGPGWSGSGQGTLGGMLAPPKLLEASQWHTPRRLASCAVGLVSARGRVALDLGAGGGAMTKALLDGGAAHVIAVENDPAWVPVLRKRFASERGEDGSPLVTVIEADVAELASIGDAVWTSHAVPTPTVCAMNPPYERGADLAFLLAAVALCSPEASIVAILRLNALCGATRWNGLWRDVTIEAIGLCESRPSFGGPELGSPASDFCAVAFRDGRGAIATIPHSHFPRVVGWPGAWS